jgi:hypothetical protein
MNERVVLERVYTCYEGNRLVYETVILQLGLDEKRLDGVIYI